MPYSFQFTLSGSPTPTVYVNDGTMPPGLTLSPDGTVSGTPTEVGGFTLNLVATNGANAGETWGMASFSITPPDTIRVQVHHQHAHSKDLIGAWDSGTFSGSCPASHPYLVNTNYAEGRISPDGVIYVTNTGMAATAVSTGHDERVEGAYFYRAHKSIAGTFTNWAWARGILSVTLECTNIWDKAKVYAGPVM